MDGRTNEATAQLSVWQADPSPHASGVAATAVLSPLPARAPSASSPLPVAMAGRLQPPGAGRLPLAGREPRAARYGAREPLEGGSTPEAALRVGVVDSDPRQSVELAEALAAEAALTMCGIASSFEGGLVLAGSGVDLLLVDCGLPAQGAPRLARALRRELPAVAVVGLSSRRDRCARAALIAAGAAGALDRQMAPEDLAMVVREAFGSRSLLRLAHA
jgi:CheY-like chemotaxis protein